MTATCDCLMFWKFDVENICILLYAIIISYLQTLSTHSSDAVKTFAPYVVIPFF